MCALSFTPGDDFVAVTDGMSSVTLTQSQGSLSVEVMHALHRAMETKEAKQSGGRYTVNDVVWHLPASELPEPPRLGDLLVDAQGQRWTILQVQAATQGSRWRCVARNLTIVEGLDQTVGIEQAIHDRWAETAALAALLPAERVTIGRTVGASRPCAVLTCPRRRAVLRTNDGGLDDVTLQIDLWHDRYDAGQTILTELVAALDRADFPLSEGRRVVQMRRTTDAACQQDDGVWRWSIEFLVQVYLPSGV